MENIKQKLGEKVVNQQKNLSKKLGEKNIYDV